MISTPSRLRDAHVHLYAYGLELSCVGMATCASAEECLQRIAAASHGKGPQEWIACTAARVEGWREARWPTAREIDAAAGGRPCFVRSFDLHAVAAGAAALRLAGIGPATPDPVGAGKEGVIVRDAAGAPTGLLLEGACELLWRAMPQPTPEEFKERVRAALRDFRRRGFAEVHDMWSQRLLGPSIAALIDEGEEAALAVRVWLYPVLEDVEWTLEHEEAFARDTLRLAGGKIFLDGTLNSRTAWMLGPYPEPLPGLPNGKAMHSPEGIEAAVRRCDALGLPLAMHAIGDAAVRAGLDAIERVSPDTAGFRIEHCQFVEESDVPRFADLGVIASVQPCHLLPDIEALRRRTPHRIDRAFPLRDLVDAALAAGLQPQDAVWFGSDAPVVEPEPADNAQAAAHRRRGGMPAEGAIAPEQAITEAEAWACMRAQAWEDEG